MKIVKNTEFCAEQIMNEGGDSLAYFEYLYIQRNKKMVKITKGKSLQNALGKYFGTRVSSQRTLKVMRFLSRIGVGTLERDNTVSTASLRWNVCSREVTSHLVQKLDAKHSKAA